MPTKPKSPNAPLPPLGPPTRAPGTPPGRIPRVFRCAVCKSSARAEVEFELARKVPVRLIAQRYKLGKDTVQRHKTEHLSASVKRALSESRPKIMDEVELEKLRVEESRGLLERLVWQRARLHGLLADAERFHDVNAGNAVHRTLLRNLELTGRIVGQIDAQNSAVIQQNLTISPDYLRLRAALLRALYSFPAARRAVLAELQKIEGTPQSSDAQPQLEANAESDHGKLLTD